MLSVGIDTLLRPGPGRPVGAPAGAVDRPLHELFDTRAAARPRATAATHGGAHLTYGELRARSDELAERLVESGVRAGDNVGVCGSRGLDALVAFLGILKAGAAYVPLDDTVPPARLRAMAEDAGVQTAVVLPGAVCRIRRLRTRLELAASGEEQSARERAGGEVAAGEGRATERSVTEGLAASGRVVVGDTARAYVMFTSGSTGRPKAVAVPHRGVVRLARSDLVGQRPRPGDRVLHGYGLSSDASTIEIWSTLLGGACLVLVDREELLSPAVLEGRIRAERVTIAYLTTSVFHHVARSRPGALRTLRFASAGGEAMDPDLVRAVQAACPDTTLVNFYGPTENTVVSTAHLLWDLAPGARVVPIGRPLEHVTCHVVRADGTAAEVGEEGDLLVGGDGLALGYLGDPELTAERFVDNPFEPGTLLYRTGDRAVLHTDGDLEYRGRSDRQVKLRGHRIELDGIEARLRAHDAVAEAVVDLDGDVVIGFVTPARAGVPGPVDRVRQDLAAWLPAPAVPSRLVEVAAFPVAAGGKVDRAALRALASATTAGAAASTPGAAGSAATSIGTAGMAGVAGAGGVAEGVATQEEAELAEIWHTVLRVRPAVTDSFFDVGGDSLLAAEVVTRTLTALDLDARHGSALIHSLLRRPTLAGFADAVAAVRGDGRDESDTVDFAAESRLGFPVPAAHGPPPRWDDPEHVLLTGASGFVGAFLLDRLLRTTGATVHCPVRARDPLHAKRRVLANLIRFGLDAGQHADRVVCFPADMGAPGMGLAQDHAAALAGTLDLAIHSAAQANFLYPYQALRPSNVDGTREVVRLAAARRVPVHFLSTIAVVAGFGTAGVRHVPEDLPLAHPDRLTMGYAESKWVAERVLQEAAALGVPMAIHRPYEITGDRRSGACNTETAICSLFKTIAETGLAPDIPLPMDFVPVDWLAGAVVHIATTHPATGRTYHLTNPRPARLSDVLDRMRLAGYRIDELPYDEWVGELVRHVSEHPTSPTAPFVSLCVDRSNKADMSVKEMYFEGTFPTLGRANVERDLAGSGLHCPPVDDALLDRYLEYFFSSGYLRRPQGASMTVRSITEMYGHAYRVAHDSGARPDTTMLTYGFRDGSSYTEDVATYFAGREAWWTVDAQACELATGRVLAVGCGVGRHALEVARAGLEVVGLEASDDAVAVARERGLDTRLGGVLDLPADLGTFDTFLFAGGGLHLLFLPDHREDALKHLAAVANPGARIIGTCPVMVDDAEGPGVAEDDTYDYRLRVEHGGEVTEWSSWGIAPLSGPEHLADLAARSRWTVEEVRHLRPPEVPSYLAVLRLTGEGTGR